MTTTTIFTDETLTQIATTLAGKCKRYNTMTTDRTEAGDRYARNADLRLQGMEQLLDNIGIKFDYEYDESGNFYTAVIVETIKVEIEQ